MPNIDLWIYWWYVSPFIFAIGCLVAGLNSRRHPGETPAIFLVTLFTSLLWPIVLPVVLAGLIIFVPGLLLYQLGRWLGSKFK